MTKLNIQLEELISENAEDFEVSRIFRTYLKNYVDSIDMTVETTGGKDFLVKHTRHTDKFLILLYKYMLRKYFGNYQPMSSCIPIVFVALGSYGREQLCIYSDIDLMILYEDIKGYNIKVIMEEFVALAWDCGLKLGLRVHELKDVEKSVKEDVTIKSSILESRMICGSKHLWYSYEKTLKNIKNTNKKGFILKKLKEHKKRLLKYPLKMEPNIKDGYGGIREANMIFWMGTVVYAIDKVKELTGKEFSEEEYKKYRSSLEYIFQVRSALHSVAKRKTDVVNFDLLPELSSKLGFRHTPRMTKERQCMTKIMEALHRIHFFSTIMVKKFTRQIVFEKENISKIRAMRYEKNLYIYKNRVYTSFNAKPKTLNSLLKELISLPNEIKSFDRSYIYFVSKAILPNKQSKELKKTMKNLLCKQNLYPIIKLIYNARLFEIILPITKRIINQPQFDGYHEHPVDIHSIGTLKKLQDISDNHVKEVYDTLEEKDRVLVRLIALFHDAGKGRAVDHHIVGQKIFKNMLVVYNFSFEDIQIGARLVRYHNLMSKVATAEDFYSEKIILGFIAILQTRLALKMLYVVTYADISAVGEGIYKSSTASLLRQLYLQALRAFENKELLNESKRRVTKQETIKKSPIFKELSPVKKKKIMYITSNQIFLQHSAKNIISIALNAYDVDDFKYELTNETNLKIKIIRKVPLNLGFLLGKLEFLDISTMNIFKLYDSKKYFEISFSQKIQNKDDLIYIKNIIENSFDMGKKAKLLVPMIKRSDISIDCNHTTYLASMKVYTKDQRGLFAYIAKIFDDFNIEIESAKLSSKKGMAKDLFLIEKNGNFCENQDFVLNQLCQES